MSYLSLKKIFLLMVSISSIALLASAYMQLHQKLSPCPLCNIQRAAYLFTGLIAIVGIYTRYKKSILTGLISLSLLAAMVAGYHLLLQYDVVKAPGFCITHTPLPAEQFEQILLQSNANSMAMATDCSKKSSVIWGLPISFYNFVYFLTIGLILTRINIHRKKLSPLTARKIAVKIGNLKTDSERLKCLK